jgi:hypothetical protein
MKNKIELFPVVAWLAAFGVMIYTIVSLIKAVC